MEISLYLASNLPNTQIFGKVQGNFHVPCHIFHPKEHGNFAPCNLAVKYMARYMEISMYVATKHMATTWKFSMYLFSGIAKKYTEISLYQCIRAAQKKHGNYRTPALYKRTLKRFIEQI